MDFSEGFSDESFKAKFMIGDSSEDDSYRRERSSRSSGC
jgi:hypothetical protein